MIHIEAPTKNTVFIEKGRVVRVESVTNDKGRPFSYRIVSRSANKFESSNGYPEHHGLHMLRGRLEDILSALPEAVRSDYQALFGLDHPTVAMISDAGFSDFDIQEI